jgi:hypothetical protein
MVITRLEGGLGNQLFQYAVGRSVAVRTGRRLFLDCSSYRNTRNRQYGLCNFEINATVLPESIATLFNGFEAKSAWKQWIKQRLSRTMVRLNDRGHGFDVRVNELPGHCRLSGAWQSEQYFSSMRTELLKELRPRRQLVRRVGPLCERVAKVNSVAIHVRRGDLVANPYYRNRVGTLTQHYYESAIEQLAAELPDMELFVFSEDVEWCRKHIRSNRRMTIVSQVLTHSPAQDLLVMSHCRHFIIANSTFSWWGAWLATNPDKCVIAPSRFFRTSVPWDEHIVPAGWRRIDAELSAAG